MGRLRKIVIIIFLVAIYMNIGWVVAKYDNEHRTCVIANSNSFSEKFIRGPNSSLYETRKCEEDFKLSNNPEFHFVLALIWPFFILVPTISWIMYESFVLLDLLLEIITKIVWFVFGGGIAKSLNLI